MMSIHDVFKRCFVHAYADAISKFTNDFMLDLLIFLQAPSCRGHQGLTTKVRSLRCINCTTIVKDYLRIDHSKKSLVDFTQNGLLYHSESGFGVI